MGLKGRMELAKRSLLAMYPLSMASTGLLGETAVRSTLATLLQTFSIVRSGKKSSSVPPCVLSQRLGETTLNPKPLNP